MGHFSWTRPDPTRRNVDPTRPAIADKKSDPTRPDPRPDPSPHMNILQLNYSLLIILLLCIKYRRKSINPNSVFEDSYWFRYQEIISKKLKKCWPDPTRPAKIRENRDPTRPDPTRRSIRPVDNSAMVYVSIRSPISLVWRFWSYWTFLSSVSNHALTAKHWGTHNTIDQRRNRCSDKLQCISSKIKVFFLQICHILLYSAWKTTHVSL